MYLREERFMPATPATLADLVHDVAQRDGAKTAIIFADQPITYTALDQQIEQVANALAVRGIAHGDRVAIMLPNIPQYVITYYAIMRLGAIVVPVNVLYRDEEIAYVLQDSEAKALVIYDGFWQFGASAVQQAPSVEQVIVAGQGETPVGTTPWTALVQEAAPQRPPVSVQPDAVATICYTSGTTGRSKGAMLTHRNFLSKLRQLDQMPRCKAEPDDIILLVLPLFHIYAMNVCMNGVFRVGASFVLLPRF
jgi:long-chain acyl-CoA synthetase